MAVTLYNKMFADMMKGQINFHTGGDTFHAILLTAAAAIDPDDTTVTAALTGNTEVSGGNYARQALTSQAVTQDDTNDKGKFTAGNVIFPGVAVGQDPVGAMVIKYDTDDDNSTPICYIDNLTGLPLTADGGNVTVNWPSDGIVNLNSA